MIVQRMIDANECECGCGGVIPPGRRFVSSHDTKLQKILWDEFHRLVEPRHAAAVIAVALELSERRQANGTSWLAAGSSTWGGGKKVLAGRDIATFLYERFMERRANPKAKENTPR